MFTDITRNVHWYNTQCSLIQHAMFSDITRNVLRYNTICSLIQHAMFSDTTRYVHWYNTICSLIQHAITRNVQRCSPTVKCLKLSAIDVTITRINTRKYHNNKLHFGEVFKVLQEQVSVTPLEPLEQLDKRSIQCYSYRSHKSSRLYINIIQQPCTFYTINNIYIYYSWRIIYSITTEL